MRTGRAALFCSVALWSGALTAGAVQAQETAPPPAETSTPNETVRTEDATGVAEVVVTARNYVPEGAETATKSGAPLIETPQSVSVVTRDQIDLLNFINVQQAVRYTAGIVGENYGPDLRYDFLTLRGFTPKQYIDGLQAPITTTILNVGADLYGFDSVDILKGPSAVLYGNTPPGGIYNLTSRRASSDFGGELEALYGTHDYKQVNGTITGPVTSFADVRLTGMILDRESQVDFVEAERYFFAPTATFRIGEDTELTLLYFYQYDDVRGDTNGFLPSVGTRFPNPLGQIPRERNLGEPDYNRYQRDQYAVGWELRHDLSDNLRLTQNAKYSKYEEEQQVVYGGGGLAADNRTVFRFNFPYAEEVESFAVDNRLQAEFETGAAEHEVLVGLDYRDVENLALFGFGLADPIDAFNPVYNAAAVVTPPLSFSFNDQRVTQTGLYLQDQIRIGGLILTASGRYDWVDLENRAAPPGQDNTTEQNEFSYRVGANYLFENGFAPYISYATSFEPVLGTDFTDPARPKEFEPSTSSQIEAGVKYDGRLLSPDIQVFATAAVYKIEQENLVSVQSGATPQFGTQIGEVEAQGFELEGVARIRDQLTINGAYSYTDTEIVKAGVAAAEGNPLPTTPKHKFSLLVDYTLQRGPLAGLGGGVGVRYLSSSAGSIIDAFNPSIIYSESTTLWDALLHYDLPEWRIALNGSNIFDEEYVGRCASPSGCIYGQARQVMLSIARKF